MEYDPLKNEYAPIPRELATPVEQEASKDEEKTLESRESLGMEYEGKRGKLQKEENKHGLVKKLFMMPVASAIAAVAIVFASYGHDPLGEDFLSHDVIEADNPEGQEEEHGGRQRDPQDGVIHGDPVIVREYPGDLEGASIHVTYVPTGEKFLADSTGEEGLEEAREWVRRQGGDPATLTYVDHEETFTGHYDVSDDAIIVGDLVDDPEHAYIAQGTVTPIMRIDVYYEAHEKGREILHASDEGQNLNEEDSFPKLSNLDPDFAGNHAWDVYGSETFIRLYLPGETVYAYLEAGEYWVTQEHAQVVEIPGIWYDADANKLTMENFEAAKLETNLMGNGFTIELIGNSYVDQMIIYGAKYAGSVKFTGTGSLVINDHWAQDGIGLWLYSESSESCLMVDQGVTIEAYGDPAVYVMETMMENAIYLGKDVEMDGGNVVNGDWTAGMENRTVHDVSIMDDDGNLSQYVHFSTVE